MYSALTLGVSSLETIVIVVYLLVVGYLGFLGYQRTKTAADYMVAGRRVHPFVMALSYGATFISTSAIVGFGGVAGMFGMSLLWLTFLNIFVGIFIAFVFLGGPTRNMGHRLDAHTFPELIGRRFQSKFLQVFAGLVIFLFIPLYASAVLIGGCQFISTQFSEISYEVAVLVFSVIIAAYVVVGGLKGVMYTDALQGSIMFIGMVVLLIWTYAHLGGMTEAHEGLSAIAADPTPGVSPFVGFKAVGQNGWMAMPSFGWGDAVKADGSLNPIGHNLWWIVVSTITLGVGIGVLAQPQLAVRFMTVKSKRELNRAVLVGGVFILVMTGVAFTVGSLSNVFFAREEVIKGEIVDISENALVTAKVRQHPKLVKKVPCTILHLDTDATPDGIADTWVVAHGAEPVKGIMPSAVIDPPDAGVGDRAEIRPRANSFLRAVAPRGDGWLFDTGKIIPTYIKRAMPPWFGVVFMLTLLAAAMSTLSSQFHAVGTSIGRDVYEQFCPPKGAESTRSILVVRIGIVIGIVLAVLIAYSQRGGFIIARATAIFFGLCASAFLPTFIGGLFWKRMTRAGAIASMVVGFLVTAFWLIFIHEQNADGIGIIYLFTGDKPSLLEGTWQVVDPLVVALPLSILTAVIVSLATRPPSQEHLNRCFGGPKNAA